MKVWLLVIVTMLVVAGAGCGGSSPPAAVSVQDPETGAEISVRAGGTLEILLEGNPTTGYTWQIGSVDSDVLKPIGDPSYATSSSALGAGGIFTFAFEGLKEGTTDLTLVYLRPWETGVPPEKTIELLVQVKE